MDEHDWLADRFEGHRTHLRAVGDRMLRSLSEADDADPEGEALLADSVGLALLVVLETLEPAERLALVLHDMFAVPFDEIAPIVGRSPAAARQLASRARRRLQGATVPDTDLTGQRQVVDAFFAAARDGDFDALAAVLHPGVVPRSDGGDGRQAPSGVVTTRVASGSNLASQPGEWSMWWCLEHSSTRFSRQVGPPRVTHWT